MDKTDYKFSLKGAKADLDACALFLLPESRTGGKRNIGCSVQYFGFYICKKDWLNFFIYKNLFICIILHRYRADIQRLA